MKILVVEQSSHVLQGVTQNLILTISLSSNLVALRS